MGKEMEEAGNEYTCPKCTEKKENEVNEKQTFQLKVKLKERQAVKSKKQPPVKSPGAGSGPALKSPGGANKKDSTNTSDQTVSPPDKNKKQVIYFDNFFVIVSTMKENHGIFERFANEINEFRIGLLITSQCCFLGVIIEIQGPG